ncbi:unnamed protein product [Blepharisma stoltei]|uniref:Protein HIRA n=1 Tax=Blepharisma stoltei TaxID=1481888 RepID=A0AAU9IXU4_9CILI|nr:unnamed protein product [Blepharisma stoltei]
MWIVKPEWIFHGDTRKLPILSIDIEPAGARFITGSMDHTIIIWKLSAINDEQEEEVQLSILTQHCGPVNCVRWSPSSQYFASGSDDGIVIIWEQVEAGLSDNLEEWRCILSLRGHSSDVKELSWNNSGTLLASGSVDNTVILWNIVSKQLAPARILNGHESYISGLAFDPMDRYLATVGEDKQLIIWSTNDWKQIKKISQNFNHASSQPLKRFSYTPDGLNLILPGPKKSAYKYTASVLKSDEYEIEKYLVGHLQAISVAAASKVLYKSDKNPVWIVALGGYDSAVSFWKNGDNEPVVIKDIFACSVADISWSNDGNMILACSSDGTVAAIGLDGELGTPLSQQEMNQYMFSLYGSRPPVPIGGPHSHSHHKRIEPQPLNEQKEERVQGGKRRIQPVLLSTPQSTGGGFPQSPQQLPQISSLQLPQASLISSPNFPQPQLRNPIIMTSPNAPPVPDFKDLQNFSIPFFASFSKVINKGTSKSYTDGICDMKMLEISQLISADADMVVECMEVKTHPQFKSIIRFREGNKTLWQRYLPHTANVLTGSDVFIAAITAEGFLYCFATGSGRQIMPELCIGAVDFFESNGAFLIVILKDGKVQCWNIKNQSIHLESNIKSIAGPIVKAVLKENGEVLIENQAGEGYIYDLELHAWARVKDPTFIQKPDERMSGWNPGSIEEVLNVDLQTFHDFSLTTMEMQLLRLKKLGYTEEYAYNLVRYAQMLADGKDMLRLWDICMELKRANQNLLASIMPILNANQLQFKGINC